MSDSKVIIEAEITGKKNIIRLIDENHPMKISFTIAEFMGYKDLKEICSKEQINEIAKIVTSALNDKIIQLEAKLQKFE